MNDFLPVIRGSRLFSGVTEEEARAMLDCLGAKTRRFPKDAYILRPGDRVDAIGLMLEGGAWIVQEDFWGNRNIMAHIDQGQSFAETFACTSGTARGVSVLTEQPCTVMFFNINRVLTVCPAACAYHSRIIRNLLSDLAEKNLRFHEKLTHMGQRTTRAKLLSYLSAQAQRHGGNTFDIPFSRQQLADYLAVDRSGLSQELCKMRDEGLLSFHRNHFVLK